MPTALADIFARSYPIDEGLCFVIMPFAPALEEIYDKVIKPALTSEPVLMRCVRGDEVFTNEPIMADVWALIQKAEVVVADLTGKNPNVLYELGLAHALWKKVILLAQAEKDLPFDLRHMRALLYKPTLTGAEKLRGDLVNAITEIRGLPQAPARPAGLQDARDGLDEFAGLRQISMMDASRTRALVKRAHSTQIRYPHLTISMSVIEIAEDGQTRLSIGYEFIESGDPFSLELQLYPSRNTTITTRGVPVFYVVLVAVDFERKSALVEVVPKRQASDGAPVAPPPVPEA